MLLAHSVPSKTPLHNGPLSASGAEGHPVNDDAATPTGTNVFLSSARIPKFEDLYSDFGIYRCHIFATQRLSFATNRRCAITISVPWTVEPERRSAGDQRRTSNDCSCVASIL